MKTKITFYEIFGIERDADTKDIKRAYKILAKTDHPDINGNSKSVNKRMALLNMAYETLIDPIKRREYDKQIEDIDNQGNTGVQDEDQYRDQGREGAQKKGSWWTVVIILLIALSVPIISQNNANSHDNIKPVIPTISANNSKEKYNTDTTKLIPNKIDQNIQQTINNNSCGVNSHLSNSFCICDTGFSRNHNTGQCERTN